MFFVLLQLARLLAISTTNKDSIKHGILNLDYFNGHHEASPVPIKILSYSPIEVEKGKRTTDLTFVNHKLMILWALSHILGHTE